MQPVAKKFACSSNLLDAVGKVLDGDVNVQSMDFRTIENETLLCEEVGTVRGMRGESYFHQNFHQDSYFLPVCLSGGAICADE